MVELNNISLARLMVNLGYETVNNCSILNKLSYITPSGGTALRDSIKTGIEFTLDLNSLLMQLGAGSKWNFVHIVITDGSDTSSNCPLENLATLFLIVGQKIPKERCLTVFIGVELDVNAYFELKLLTEFGGENCQIYNIKRVELDSIFQKITAKLIGVRREVEIGLFAASGVTGMAVSQRDRPVYNVTRTNFAVLLNLDISGSMKGARFEALKESVYRFLRNLDGNDLVSCLVFNDQVNMIQSLKFAPNIPPPKQLAIKCEYSPVPMKKETGYNNSKSNISKPRDSAKSKKPVVLSASKSTPNLDSSSKNSPKKMFSSSPKAPRILYSSSNNELPKQYSSPSLGLSVSSSEVGNVNPDAKNYKSSKSIKKACCCEIF